MGISLELSSILYAVKEMFRDLKTKKAFAQVIYYGEPPQQTVGYWIKKVIETKKRNRQEQTEQN